MKRWLGVLLMIVLGVPLISYGIGLFIPRDHVASGTVNLAASPDAVWALVSDFANTPKWRTDITGVRMHAPGNGPIRFTESSSQGDVTFEVISQEPPRRQVVRVVDDDQPFGGTWTWNLAPAGSGTRLTIIEAGFIKNPIFRTMGAIFFSPSETIDGYLAALGTETTK